MIRHHGNHRGLLTEFSAFADVGDLSAGQGELDAVVVPSGRGAQHLGRAFEVAEYLGRPLVALCSMETSAGEVEEFARAAGVGADVKAIDIAASWHGGRDFGTTEYLRSAGLLNQVDTSLKRNVGLAIAQLCGWRRVLYLDDDVTIPVPEHLRQAAALLGTYGAVGMDNIGYRDNSVVCHANRSLPSRSEAQKQFISTMALLVDPVGVRSFFPHIYNEDWLYLIADDECRTRLAVAGEVKQDEYDPFKADRASREELGDTIAEGLYWLLDNAHEKGGPGSLTAEPVGESVWKGADEAYWGQYLFMRRDLIGRLRDSCAAEGGYEQVIALDAASKASADITPELCAEYVRRWQEDLYLWQQEGDERAAAQLSLDDAIAAVLGSTWRL